MINPGSYIWHKTFGIGRVISSTPVGSDNVIKVSFFGGETKSLMEKMSNAIRIPDELITFIKRGGYLDAFKPFDLEIAKALSAKIKPNELIAEKVPFSLSASVTERAKEYLPKVEAYKDQVIFSCSCSKGHECVHDAALFVLLSRIISELSCIDSYSDDDPIVDLTKKFFGSNAQEANYSMLKNIAGQISESYGEEQFTSYLKYISKTFGNKIFMPKLLSALALNTGTAKMASYAASAISEKYAIPTVSQLMRLVKSSPDYSTGDVSPHDTVMYHYYNDMYENLIHDLLNYPVLYDDTVAAAREVSVKLSESEKLFEYLIEDIPSGTSSEYVEILFKNLDNKHLDRIYSLQDYPFSRPAKHISSMPIDSYIDGILQSTISADEKSVDKIIRECRDEKKCVAALHKIITENTGTTIAAKIRKCIRGFPDNHYLNIIFDPAVYLRNHFFYLNILGSFPRLNDKAKKELFRYFYMNVELSRIYEEPALSYRLYTYSSNKPLVEVSESRNGRKTLEYYAFEDNDYYRVSSTFLEEAKKILKKEAQTLLEEYEEEQRRRKEERRRQDLIRQIKEISSISEYKIALGDKTKADIDFYFSSESSSWHNNLDFSMSMKIGITKKYLVKDTLEFLDYFNSGKTLKYGKDLEFTHTLDNIAENKRKTLKLLMLLASGYTERGRQKKYLPLSSTALYDIIESLKGQKLFFNDIEYRVVFDELPFDVGINGKYEITVTGQDSPNRYFVSKDGIIVFDDDEHRIDVIKGNDEQLRLYGFAIRNKGLSVEPVLDEFKENILAKYYPYITVDDAVKDSMTVSAIDINAYFDYSDKAITVKTVIERDGKKLSEKLLSANNDLIRYHTYNSYLASLGFIDDALRDDAKILNFFSMDMTELKRYCNVYLSDSIQNKKLYSFTNQSIRISYESGLMNAFLERSDYSDEELEAILKAIRKKKNYVLLSGDRIVDISGEEAKEFEKAVSDLGLNSKKLSERNEISVQTALKGFAHESNCHIDDYLFNMVNDIKNFKKSAQEVPDVNAELRPYQEEGFKWLSTLSKYHVGGILADDMGLGKTLEVITKIKADKEQQPNLVVCPKSLVFNWINEFHKFDPDSEVVEIYGTPAVRKGIIRSILPEKKVTYVTSYDSLRNDLDYYTMTFNNLVLDEAQYIKNVSAQKSISVKQIKAAHKIALTGTPIENNIIDLWSIFDFIMPGYFEELGDFKSYYSHDSEFTKLVARRIAPFVLRRTKGDVLKDLPDKYERIISVEMTPDQRKVYDAYVKKARDLIEEGGKAFDILPYLMRLRQICDDPSMFAEDYHGESAKINELINLVEEYTNNGHRILVFSQFVKGLEQIEEKLNEKSIRYYKITGDTPSKERIEKMDKFNASNDVNVFLISLKAGGTGLNLTGADTVIHLDPWWNVAAENQASDRAHRIGQTKNVEVIKLICENSVEQRVIELQNMKKDLIDKLISNTDESVTGISLEDISFILK